MRRLVALAAVVACGKQTAAADAAADAGLVVEAASQAQSVELDALRLRPCTLTTRADDAEAALACGREWALTYAGAKEHVADPKWICPSATGYDLYFEAKPGSKAPLVKAEIYRKFMTIAPHEYHPIMGGPKAPECTERKVAASTPAPPPPASAPPPPVAEAVRLATAHVKTHALLIPAANPKPAGHCGPSAASPKCEALGRDRWVLFASEPQVVFFVRVDGANEAHFDDPWPGATPATVAAPWKECGCESLPGFDVHLPTGAKPVE